MKALLYKLAFLLILIGCERKPEIPIGSKITAKYIVLNENISRRIIHDITNVKEFDKSDNNDKEPFKIDGKVYKIDMDFRLYPDGRLKILNENLYHSFNYSDFGLKKIEINRKTIGEKFSIKFSPFYDKIIDCNDTLKIEKNYSTEKLLFVKENRDSGRIRIYEYK
ncbi:hypothetical protein [Flavobacterium sp. MDT1-60]|uniref:hypothetical protein n=1 Tax=Flavobacterium sp. MDT1-60 TaxID=1979344 RepID=UPI00177BA727|nr:hypothetical protein [Flavobacterium sp. MDT1-60]QOG01928.1 hypothetical protein IHE43_19320 [Flavobacterium sp. MDT1-60]